SLSSIRDDVPAALDALIMRTLSKDPAARPQSMEELGRGLLDAMGMAYPSISKIDLAFFDSAPPSGPMSALSMSALTTPPPSPSPMRSPGALLTRLRAFERKKVAIAAGGLSLLVVLFVVLGVVSTKRRPAPVVAATVPAAPAPVVPPPAPVVPPTPEPAAAA